MIELGPAVLYNGETRDVMRQLVAAGVQVDSVVTDPPYEIGFMGRAWDSRGVAFDPETWRLALQQPERAAGKRKTSTGPCSAEAMARSPGTTWTNPPPAFSTVPKPARRTAGRETTTRRLNRGRSCVTFAGSGSTGLGARDEGFRPLLIEEDEHSFNIACGRIAQAVMEANNAA